MNRELIINLLDLSVSTYTLSCLINDLCNIHLNDEVEVKVVRDYSYKQGTSYHITDELTNWLCEFLDEECPVKNGCQIYKDLDTNTYYFCLTDSNYYDETGRLKGTDEIRLYFRKHQDW